MFKNKSIYTVLALNVTNREESEEFQRLAHRYGIIWYGHGPNYIYDFGGDDKHIYLVLIDKDGYGLRMLWSDELDIPFLKDYHWDGKVYRIEDYDKIHEFLKYDGKPTPNYRPKKIDRTL